MDTAVELDFADGRYRFWLPLPQLFELERGPQSLKHEDAYPRSVFAMFDAMSEGLGLQDGKPVYLGPGGLSAVMDVRETIRLGLIGGNSGTVDGVAIEVGPQAAKRLVDSYVYPERPFVEGVYLAWSILHAAISGVDLKKKADPEKPKSRSRSAKGKSSPTAES